MVNDQWQSPAQAVSERDAAMMRLAITQANMAEQAGEVPVGAVLAREDEVLGVGYNQPIGANDPTAHAEIVALRDAALSERNYRLPGTTLYVTLEPCAMCAGALMHARVARLVIGTREPRAGVVRSQLGLLDESFFNHRIDIVEGVLREECSELLKRFFAQRRAEQAGPRAP